MFPCIAESPHSPAAERLRTGLSQTHGRLDLRQCLNVSASPTPASDDFERKGFVVKPGYSLIASLIEATQPHVSSKLYSFSSFSCYRATEYLLVLLPAIAQEVERNNPELLARLQQQWGQRPIMSGQFHDVFLREYGSMQGSLPPKYYVPGDRLWFRNPDGHSSDVSGYAGVAASTRWRIPVQGMRGDDRHGAAHVLTQARTAARSL